MVELYKGGDQFSVVTNSDDPTEFSHSAAAALARLVEARKFDGDWEVHLRGWLTQIIEVACKLKGYKAAVSEQRLIVAGSVPPSPETLVARAVPGRSAEMVPLEAVAG